MPTVAYFRFENGNPYQQRYYASAAQHGIEIMALKFAGYRPLRHVPPCDILHLDWLHPFYKSSRRWKSQLKRCMLSYDLRRMTDLRLVWTVHNLVSHDSHLDQTWERNTVREMLQYIDAVTTFSQETLDRLCEEFPEAQSKLQFVIPHGHYINDYEPPLPQAQARNELGLPLDARVILFFGNLRQSKGVADLVSAFESLARDDVFLLIAGGQETADVAHTLNAASAHPRISLHRQVVVPADVPRYFGAADVVALPFRFILNSGSVILALSQARCVVAPNIPSLVSPIPNCARFVYSQGNVASLASMLEHALDTKDLLPLGIQARNEIARTLDWDRIGERAAAMYQRVLD